MRRAAFRILITRAQKWCMILACSYLTLFFPYADHFVFLFLFVCMFFAWSLFRCASSDEFTSRISPFNTHFFFLHFECDYLQTFFFSVLVFITSWIMFYSGKFSQEITKFWRCCTTTTTTTLQYTIFCAKLHNLMVFQINLIILTNACGPIALGIEDGFTVHW